MQVLKRHHVSIVLLALSLLVGLLAACGPSAPTTTTTAPTVAAAVEETAPLATSTAPPAVDGYPAPQTEVVAPSYPAEGEAAQPAPTPLPDGYPPAAADEVFQEPRFRIDQALLVAGASTVEGQAPPDVALAVLDVSFNGAVLGTGRSDADGRFSIAVSPELVGGNRIGVTVAELQPGQSLNQMAEAYFPNRGEGFMNLPNIGILFDTALVQP
jgi:hypothetical protein